MMLRSISRPLMLLALTSACYHKTQLAAAWSEPNAQPVRFHKMLAVFVTKDEGLRRSVEDKLAGSFVNAIPAYQVLPRIDTGAVLDQLRLTGFDGAVIMRVVKVSTQTTYLPGSYWYGTPYTFAGYWRSSWEYAYDPGYVVQDQVVSVETQVHSLLDDKLVFAARSETTNPSSVGKLIDSVIRHVTGEMKKRGLMAMRVVTAVRAIAV